MTQIDQDATTILRVLTAAPRNEYVDRNALASLSNLCPERINDAVALLVDSGDAEWIQTYGTAPYDFNSVSITTRGRYEAQRLPALTEESKPDIPSGYVRLDERSIFADPTAMREVMLPPSPIGSPYGFTDEDWEAVAERKNQPEMLYVVLGHQFESEFFETVALRQNIQAMLRRSVDRYNREPIKWPLTLAHVYP